MNVPKVPPQVIGWVAVIVIIALAVAYFRKQVGDAADAATDAINIGSRTNLASRAANAVVGGLTSADDGVQDSVGTYFFGLFNSNDGYTGDQVQAARDRP